MGKSIELPGKYKYIRSAMKSILVLFVLSFCTITYSQTLMEITENGDTIPVPNEQLHHYDKLFNDFRIDSVVAVASSNGVGFKAEVKYENANYRTNFFSLTKNGYKFYSKFARNQNISTYTTSEGKYIVYSNHYGFSAKNGYNIFTIEYYSRGNNLLFKTELTFYEDGNIELMFVQFDRINLYTTSYYLSRR